jgi:uncharacterized membrane protein YraQ (UPF0718 family)
MAMHMLTKSRAQMIFQIAVLVVLLISLMNYKGAAGISRIQQARATGTLHFAELPIGRDAASNTSTSLSAVAYLKIVWPALVFGILLSAAVRISISRTPLHRIFDGVTAHDQLAAALAGAPLMLCSCCAAPMFPAVYQTTRKIASSLALVLAAPSLNPAALALSFMLFPWRIAGVRLAMALLLVLLGSVGVARITRAQIGALPLATATRESTWAGLIADYTKSVAYISLRTVPLLVIGIWASMWIMSRVTLAVSANSGRVLAIVAIAFLAVLLALLACLKFHWQSLCLRRVDQQGLPQRCCSSDLPLIFHPCL